MLENARFFSHHRICVKINKDFTWDLQGGGNFDMCVSENLLGICCVVKEVEMCLWKNLHFLGVCQWIYLRYVVLFRIFCSEYYICFGMNLHVVLLVVTKHLFEMRQSCDWFWCVPVDYFLVFCSSLTKNLLEIYGSWKISLLMLFCVFVIQDMVCVQHTWRLSRLDVN